MITVAGLTPSLDLTYLVDDLRLGEIHRPTQLVACAGGKSLNMARVAHRLGADVRVIAVLGGPTGENVAARLSADGVAFDVVGSPVETRTCVSIASAGHDELTEVYQYAPPMPSEVWRRFLATADVDLTRRPGWLAISGAPPAELPDDALADLIRLAHDRGVRAAVDTHGPALSAAIDVGPELVKVNRAEAAELVGVPAEQADLVELAARIRARSGGTVVITDGRAGALGLAGDQILRVRPPSRIGRFPVGSGDAFLGALVAGLDRGRAVADALRDAAAAGTANALLPGPGTLDPLTVAEIAATTEVGEVGTG